jgi:hypothetical protein
MTTEILTRSLTLENLRPGAHLCCLYGTEEEHRAVLAPYLRRGLEQGEKTLYIVEAHTAETILGYLSNEGLLVEQFLKSGQFAILTRTEAYMRQGFFDPEAMINPAQGRNEKGSSTRLHGAACHRRNDLGAAWLARLRAADRIRDQAQ